MRSGSRPTWRRASAGDEAGAAGIEAGEVAEIFLGGELVVEHGRVAHVADAVAGLVGLEVAEDVDRAEAGAEQAGEDAQQGGFAGAVFADEDVAAAGLKIDRDLAQRGEGAKELGDLSSRAQKWTGGLAARSFGQLSRGRSVGLSVGGGLVGWRCARERA